MEREYLPHSLSGCGKEVSEFIRARPEVSDTMPARKGSDVEQYSTRSGELHQLTIRSLHSFGQGGRDCVAGRAGLRRSTQKMLGQVIWLEHVSVLSIIRPQGSARFFGGAV